jgi:tRNA-5-methyluridine54 2-sulfurtransferase
MAEPAPPPSSDPRSGAVSSRRASRESTSVGEVVDYVTQYAKQETLGPLKGAGRWLGYGAAASVKVLLRNPRREVEVPGPASNPCTPCSTGWSSTARRCWSSAATPWCPATRRSTDDDVVEIRPVISGGAPREVPVCRGPAVIDVRRHNANFCASTSCACAATRSRRRSDHEMLAPGERVLVAVSGGKDSLALWDLLVELGYQADGLYVGLGIGDYSDVSRASTPGLRRRAGPAPPRSTCPAEYGFDIPTGSRAATGGRPARRAACPSGTCSTGGRARRRLRRGGHRPQPRRRGRGAVRQRAALADRLPRPPAPGAARPPGFPRKVKPLVRLGEREMAAYCVLRGIDYIVEECPMAAGNRHLGYKEALNAVEATSPGTKHDFYFGFLDRAATASPARPRPSVQHLGPPASAAVRPPRARSARSAASRAPPAPSPCRLGEPVGSKSRPPRLREDQPRSREGGMSRPLRAGRAGPARRQQAPPLPGDLEEGGRVPHPLRRGGPRRRHRRRRGHGRSARPWGADLHAIRPTLADFVLKMPRGAQVIYPKDLGPILMLADVFPGARILESGVGSGALSMTLLRAGADIVGYELRGRLRQPRPAKNVSRSSGTRRCSTGTGSRSATATRASTSRPRPGGARPPRAVAGRAPRRGALHPAASSSPTRPPSSRPPSCGRRSRTRAPSGWPRPSRS